LSADEQLELVREAEQLGYDSVWAAEAYGSDAATVLAWLAGQTEKINLGSAIFQMPARSPAMAAMTAATLDQISGGRFRLGLGPSGPQVSEGWHGVRFARQLQRTREYVEVVRKALARERLEYHGETIELPLPDGPGKALKLTIAPEQEHIPIYIAAIGPRNVTLVGEIADGWLPVFFSPEHVNEFRPLLEEGAARAGRTLDDSFDISPTVNVLVSDDIDAARAAMRPVPALYVGGRGPGWPPRRSERGRVGGISRGPVNRSRLLLGAFGDPGHAFPMIALGRALVARGHEVVLQTWARWTEHVEAAGMRFEPAPEYQVFPTRARPLKPYEAAVRAAQEMRPLVADLAPDAVV